MPKYRVEGSVGLNVSVDVEADNEDDAISKVSQKFQYTYMEYLEAEIIN
jgi:hypothetical protein